MFVPPNRKLRILRQSVLFRSASSDSLDACRRAIGWTKRHDTRSDGLKALIADIVVLLMWFMVCIVKEQYGV